MRLLETQRQAIKTIVSDIVGPENRVWLFGSRVDNTKSGEDIDLLIETDAILANRVEVLCKLEGRFAKVLGDRRIDVLLKDVRTAQEQPIYQAARAKGKRLRASATLPNMVIWRVSPLNWRRPWLTPNVWVHIA